MAVGKEQILVLAVVVSRVSGPARVSGQKKKGYSRGMETVWTLKTGEAKKPYGDLSGAYFQSKKRNRCTFTDAGEDV